jgi:pimeloyl-ACP methyl ester carboxylesterase
MIPLTRRSALTALAGVAIAPIARAEDPGDPIQALDVGDGISLHYVSLGEGPPVVFVHGSLSDMSFWRDQVHAFAAAGYRAVAYSRRYNFPNRNPPRPGYSAIVDAQDLARVIERLKLGRAHVVGHSYGALTALYLGFQRPDLMRSLTLAEPPAIPLLGHLPGEEHARGVALRDDIARHMVAPMHAAFLKGDRELGVKTFIDYVLRNPDAWDRFTPAQKAETLRNASEWDVMMTTGTLFPPITPGEVRRVRAPTLILSGKRSYPFLNLIDEDLARAIPHNRRVLLDATHAMWFERPEECRTLTLDWIAAHPG